ncbi:MAG: tetratricopeptide repeat protein [Candidatus Omnitrophica bacterium]|nr:tetratricopeptide repeat protein [Candidatus Omnitrophota bacterium]
MKRIILFLISISVLALSMSGCSFKCRDKQCDTCLHKGDYTIIEDVKEAEAMVAEVPVAQPVAPVEVAAPAVPVVVTVTTTGPRNFGDHKSSTLTTKAWQSLAMKDTEAVAVYTNKCVDMYAVPAAKMQADLKEYPAGDPQNIFSYWALNDVATSLFIQGEAYRKVKDFDKAKVAYQRVVNEFSFGQAYDPPSKSFWRPAEAAADGLYMIEKGLDLDFGDMTSQVIVRKMWDSLGKKNLEEVVAYNMKLEHLYSKTAKDMQIPLKEYPQLPAEKIHMYWALNDVGTGMFVLGEAYDAAGMKAEAKKAYQKVISDYFYAQCWDPQGWFWKPADAAQQKILEMEAVQ